MQGCTGSATLGTTKTIRRDGKRLARNPASVAVQTEWKGKKPRAAPHTYTSAFSQLACGANLLGRGLWRWKWVPRRKAKNLGLTFGHKSLWSPAENACPLRLYRTMENDDIKPTDLMLYTLMLQRASSSSPRSPVSQGLSSRNRPAVNYFLHF